MPPPNTQHIERRFFNVITFGRIDLDIFETNSGTADFPACRFEYWAEHAKENAMFDDRTSLSQLPTFIAAECQRKGELVPARFSRIDDIRVEREILSFEYSHLTTDLTSQTLLPRVVSDDWEWNRTHWAVKNGDAVAILARLLGEQIYKPSPKLFALDKWPLAKDLHCAVMMRYDNEFEHVFASISNACDQESVKAVRVKDIRGPGMVISDVFRAIEQGRFVVCDITGENPNVFYEAGLAHARNIDIIFITQDDGDKPFNIRHNRYIKYSQSDDGLRQLSDELAETIRAMRD